MPNAAGRPVNCAAFLAKRVNQDLFRCMFGYLSRSKNRTERDLHVVLGRRPGADADPHRLAALPAGPAAPAVTRFLQRGDHLLRALVIAERDDDLVQDDVVQDLDAGQGQLVREPARLVAVAVDQLGEPASAELPQGRPDIDAARAARAVRREVDGVAMLAEQEVVAGDGHRGAEASRPCARGRRRCRRAR